jgi:uncharacterized membrane protein/membrane-bound inhibitor of C-type lysozyme
MNCTKRQCISDGVLLFTVYLLSGCASSPPPPYIISAADYPVVQAPAKTYVYECSGGHSFTVRLEQGKARLTLAGQTMSLPRVPSDDGMKFSDGSVTFQMRGDEASLDLGDKAYRGCQKNLTKAAGSATKLRGVDFRAVGNEPGWSLEIDNDGSILFINNYGEDQYVFATPEPTLVRQADTTIYFVQDAEHTMTIILRDQQCYDDMSGEPFGTTVTLVFDGRRFRGCGKALL